jgi:hypothetical protein
MNAFVAVTDERYVEPCFFPPDRWIPQPASFSPPW